MTEVKEKASKWIIEWRTWNGSGFNLPLNKRNGEIHENFTTIVVQ